MIPRTLPPFGIWRAYAPWDAPMKLSLYVGETRGFERCLAATVDVERRGLHAVWVPGALEEVAAR